MNTRNIVKNIRSAEVIQGKPKLPTTGQLSEGEIAVNYAKGYETLSFKNNSNEIVSLSVKTVDDVTVNGNSVVSNKTANIIMKGNTTPVADTYTTTTYPSPFNEGAEHISASDKVDVALKKVETNISKLVSEVVDNENVVSEAISKLANSAGTVDGSNNITYVKATNAHYISDATSVHDATVKLDSYVYRAVDSLGSNVDTLNSNVNIIEGKVTNLDYKYSNLNNTDINLQDQIHNLANSAGTIDGSNNITYVKATNAHYISDATSVHDATVKLDSYVYRAVDSLGSNVDTLNSNVNIIRNDVNTIEGNVTSIGGKVTYLENNVTTITSDVSNLGTNYGRLNGTVGNLESIINSLQSTVNRLQSTVNSLQMEYVDLGLPSGLQWAKCNIGAATETDYGDYFMWGSTTPDNNHTCNWANTPFNNGSSSYDETYFNSVKDTLCPKGILAKEYDAAYKATKGIGRMPTMNEFQELFDETKNEWVEDFNGTGVNGWKFTSRTNTSKYIFIPASGYRTDSSLELQGETGDIWTSSLNTLEPDYAYNSNFTMDGQSMDYCLRYCGFTVRAVREL